MADKPVFERKSVHPFIFINGRVLGIKESRLSENPLALFHARGVLTSVAIYDGAPFLWAQHWSRLVDHAERIGLTASRLDETSTIHAVVSLIKSNGVQSGLAEVMLLERLFSSDPVSEPTIAIVTRDWPLSKRDVLTLTVSPYRVNTMSPLTGVKSVSCLEQYLSLEEAKRRDFDEAIMVNERGEIVSTTMANIFWVTEGVIHTPSLVTGAVAGITRGCIIALAGELSFPLVEGAYDLSSLSAAHEIFLTSAATELSIVNTYDFRQYTVPIGSIALRLAEAFRQLTLRDGLEMPAKSEHRTPRQTRANPVV